MSDKKQMFIREDPPLNQQQTLFEVKKQILYLKSLLARNIAYRLKLCELRDRLSQRLKQNEALEKTFKKTKKRLERQKRHIVGITFYDFDEPRRLELLNIYKTLRLPRNKERLFIRSIFDTDQEDGLAREFPEKNIKCQDVIIKYSSNPSAIPFHLMGFLNRMSGLEVYRMWREKCIKEPPKQPPTEKQDRKIQEYYAKYRENWLQISVFLEGRTPEELYYHYHKKLNQCKNKGRWQYTENLKLVILVEYYGRGNWYQIYKILKTRSDIQIRQKFCNILDPRLVVNKWTPQQQNRLLQVAELQQYKWSKIAKMPFFDNKTDNEIWRKFRNLMAEKDQQELRELVSDDALRKKILTFKRKNNIEKKEQLSETGSRIKRVHREIME